MEGALWEQAPETAQGSGRLTGRGPIVPELSAAIGRIVRRFHPLGGNGPARWRRPARPTGGGVGRTGACSVPPKAAVALVWYGEWPWRRTMRREGNGTTGEPQRHEEHKGGRPRKPRGEADGTAGTGVPALQEAGAARMQVGDPFGGHRAGLRYRERRTAGGQWCARPPNSRRVSPTERPRLTGWKPVPPRTATAKAWQEASSCRTEGWEAATPPTQVTNLRYRERPTAGGYAIAGARS